MLRRTICLATLLSVASFGAVSAHEFKSGDISVDHPMAFETSPSAMSGGGYMTITNTGTSADRLLEVRADFPKVMLHESKETDGVATMEHQEYLDIPAGETVSLEPGGYHVMFMGLEGDPFEIGEEIPATLVFERAGEIDVVFNVEARGAKAADADMDHAMHEKTTH